MSATDYDIIILGAGPAGSLAARELARRGHRVLLLDRSVFPRPKVCGNCLDPRCDRIWKQTGLWEGFRRLPHRVLDGFSLSIEHADPLHMPYPEGHAHFAVSRTLLDDWLRREAVTAGAEFRGGVSVSRLEAPATLTVDGVPCRARFLIGADGRNSWLARTAGLAPARPVPCGRVGWQTTLPAALAGTGVHMSWFEEGYWGLAPFDAEHANLCLALGKGSTTTPQQIAERHFPGVGALTWRSTTPLSRKVSQPGRGRILLAGDALRVVEPFTGEGIYLALASGVIAADVIDHALKSNRTDNAAGRHARRVKELYSGLSWQNGLLRFLGKHPRRGKQAVAWLRRHPALLEKMAGGLLPGR